MSSIVAVWVNATAATITIAGHQWGKIEMKLKREATRVEVAEAMTKICSCSKSLFIKRLSKAEESHSPQWGAVAPAVGSKLPLAAGIVDDGDGMEIIQSIAAAEYLIIAATSAVAIAA